MSDDRERKESKLTITVNENGQLNDVNKGILQLELNKAKPDEEIINQCLQGVEELNFGSGEGVVNPGQNMELFVRCLPACTTLRRLALKGINIELTTATVLEQQLSKCQSLETLDLSDNDINQWSARILALILPKLRNLHTFSINNVQGLDGGLAAFAAVLPGCLALRKLGISNTYLFIEDIVALGKGLLRSRVTDLDLIDRYTGNECLDEIASWFKFNGTLVNVGDFLLDGSPERFELQQTIKYGLKRNRDLLNSDAVKKHLPNPNLTKLLLSDLVDITEDYLNKDIITAEFLNFFVTTDFLAKIFKFKSPHILAPTDQLHHYHAIFSTKNAALNYAVDIENFLYKAGLIKKTDKIADKILLKVYQNGEEEFILDIKITPIQVYTLAKLMDQFVRLTFKREEKSGEWKPAKAQIGGLSEDKKPVILLKSERFATAKFLTDLTTFTLTTTNKTFALFSPETRRYQWDITEKPNCYQSVFAKQADALQFMIDMENFLKQCGVSGINLKVMDHPEKSKGFIVNMVISREQVSQLRSKEAISPFLVFKQEKRGVWRREHKAQQTPTAYSTNVRSGNLSPSLSADATRNSPLEVKQPANLSDHKQSVRPADPITAEQLISEDIEPPRISLTEQKAIIELIREEILNDKSEFGLNPTNTESLLEVQTVEGIQVWILSCLTPEQNQTLKNKFIDKLEEVSLRNQDSTYRACWQVLSGMDSTLATLSLVAAETKLPIKDKEKKKNPPPSAGTPSSAVSASLPLPSGPGSLGIFSISSSSFASSPLSTSLKPGHDEAEQGEDKRDKTKP